MTRFASLAAALLLPAAAAAAPVPAEKPKDVDLVLCLDVSNSMDGLIDSAKLRLWDVVNELARVKPTPNLRVALYSYGCPNYPAADGWVRKEFDLSSNLDEAYAKLNALKTNGGDEYVARVARAALLEQKWSAEPNALRVVFVCGNEAADQDKQYTAADVAAEAKKKGAVVNTIFCGPAGSAEAAGWRDVAARCGGKFASIDQDRARTEVTIATPFDDKLLKLNEKLNGTYVAAGKKAEDAAKLQVLQDRAAAAAPQAPGAGGAQVASQAALARVEAKANALYKNERWDLVDRLKADPKFDVRKLAEDELSDELKKLKPEERAEYVQKKAEEREAVQKEINDLSAKRAGFIAEERKKLPKSAGEQALDEALRGIIREQAAGVGFETPEKK